MLPVPPDAAATEAADHLSRVHGARGLQAAILALLLPPGQPRAALAWESEVAANPEAARLRAHVEQLPSPQRLPWFETLLSRMRAQPLDARQDLLEATRRLMAAATPVRPLDRLHWLAMRQRLHRAGSGAPRAGSATEISRLPQEVVEAIAAYTAYLSRLVPVDRQAGGSTTAGAAWYSSAMQAWEAHAEVPACHPPDADGLVHALQQLQALAWMHKPMLVREWLSAALRHSRLGRLDDCAADALRLSCDLLDSPLPPELARHYGTAVLEIPR